MTKNDRYVLPLLQSMDVCFNLSSVHNALLLNLYLEYQYALLNQSFVALMCSLKLVMVSLITEPRAKKKLSYVVKKKIDSYTWKSTFHPVWVMGFPACIDFCDDLPSYACNWPATSITMKSLCQCIASSLWNRNLSGVLTSGLGLKGLLWF